MLRLVLRETVLSLVCVGVARALGLSLKASQGSLAGQRWGEQHPDVASPPLEALEADMFSTMRVVKASGGPKLGGDDGTFAVGGALATEAAADSGEGEAMTHSRRLTGARVSTRYKPSRKPVMWVHVHKSGGTLMCKWASIANESVVKRSNNCNSEHLKDNYFDNPIAQLRQHTTCAKRFKFFQNWPHSPFTWGQIERELSEGDVCLDDFSYGIMLRETVSRLESHVNFEGINNYREWIACILDANTPCPAAEANLDYWVFDNFVVRTLGGYDVMTLPPGSVNSSHFDAALALLDRFDVVVLLEKLTDKRTQAAMDRALGWHIDDESPSKANWFEHFTLFSDEDVANLRRINTYDIALRRSFAKRYESLPSENTSTYE